MIFRGGVRPPTAVSCSAFAERCEQSVAATLDWWGVASVIVDWWGMTAVSVVVAGATSSNCGAMISNFPKIRLLFVRLLISGMRISGMELFERIPWSIVVSRVEIMVIEMNYSKYMKYISILSLGSPSLRCSLLRNSATTNLAASPLESNVSFEYMD